MKFTIPKMDKLLNDKNVLYVVFVLAILNLLGYLLVQNTEAVVFFLIVGFLSTYFSKNMIIVLIISMVSTSVFTSTKSRFVTEGMSTKTASKPKKAVNTNNTSVEESEESEPEDHEDHEDHEDTGEPDIEQMTTVSGKSKQPRIAYAENLENAFKRLETTVGKGGIEGLTGQTTTLLNQQKKLMNNIQGMQPFIKTAESFMSKLDLGGINGMLSKLGGGEK